MFEEVLTKIDGVTIFPIISMIIFVIFFTALGIWTFTIKKNYITKMESLPFENDNIEIINQGAQTYESK